jgi:deoxyadenosine/deoxycytidine kinase
MAVFGPDAAFGAAFGGAVAGAALDGWAGALGPAQFLPLVQAAAGVRVEPCLAPGAAVAALLIGAPVAALLLLVAYAAWRVLALGGARTGKGAEPGAMLELLVGPAGPHEGPLVGPAGPREGPLVVVVDGIIGAGKSTLVKRLAWWLRRHGVRARAVLEPVSRFKHGLERFYRDIDGQAVEFQTLVYTSRIEATLEAVEGGPPADVYILERSVITDYKVFMEMLWRSGRLTDGDARMSDYTRGWRLHARLMPLDLERATFVYLRPSVDVAMARVAARRRAAELADAGGAGGVSRAYQDDLMRRHDEVFGPGGCLADVAPGARVVRLGAEVAELDYAHPGGALETAMARAVAAIAGVPEAAAAAVAAATDGAPGACPFEEIEAEGAGVDDAARLRSPEMPLRSA